MSAVYSPVGVDLRITFTDGRVITERWGNTPHWNGDPKLNVAVFMWTEGNFSCDCNKRLFLAYAAGEEDPDEGQCGDTLTLASIVALMAGGEELTLWTSEAGSLVRK